MKRVDIFRHGLREKIDKVLDRVLFPKSVPKYYHPVTFSMNNGAPINMRPGDRTEITYGVKLNWNSSDHIVDVYSWSGDTWKYGGTVDAKKGWDNIHEGLIVFSEKEISY